MQNNVLEYLEKTVQRVPDKVAFANDKYEIDFQTVYNNARAIGSFLYNEGYYKQPIVVFMEKHPKAIVSFFGALYGGGYYVPLDEEMPKHRIELIFESLKPQIVICDEKTREQLDDFSYEGVACLYDDIINTKQDETALGYVREHHIDTDPMYIVFTSGSTGVPKGVVACHRSVIDYVEQLSETLQFDENTVFGNQSPLYFDACLKEIYPTIKFGATTYLIPKNLFMFPIKLVEFLNEKSINTICWVVSALTMISGFGVFEKVIPDKLTNIAFGSEVFPIKQFKLWRQALPNARFTNLYGPTECTGMSCYYKDEEIYSDKVVLAVGRKGASWLSDICAKHKIETKLGSVDIGIRYELPDKVMEKINEYMYEGKFIGRPFPYGDKVRTFCQNPSGFVSAEVYDNGLTLVNWRLCATDFISSWTSACAEN